MSSVGRVCLGVLAKDLISTIKWMRPVAVCTLVSQRTSVGELDEPERVCSHDVRVCVCVGQCDGDITSCKLACMASGVL